MFTLEQVNDIHSKFGNAATLAEYLQALKAIGVKKTDSFITDGHTIYYGKNGHTVVTPSAHDTLTVSETANSKKFFEYLENPNYLEMSKGFADSGVEKWTFDTSNQTITYYDQSGNELLQEAIS